jgi:polyisoprenoid-binding protein YceI
MTSFIMVVAMLAGSTNTDRQSTQAAGFEARHSSREVAEVSRGVGAAAEVTDDGSLRARINVPVDSLRSNDASTDKYLREALEVKRFPSLVIKVETPTNGNLAPGEGIQASAEVTLRGVTRTIPISLHVSNVNGREAQVSGDVSLDLDKFVPEVAMRAVPIEPTVKVHFDVNAVQEVSSRKAPHKDPEMASLVSTQQ